jgi:hypothetical protein
VHHRAVSTFRLLLIAAAALALSGCPRRIGDGCTQNIDCSLNADRTCDLAQLGGYCTIRQCDPNRCPDNAMCIEFDSNVPRLARRYCMSTCNTNGDCRGGYMCARPTVGPDGTCPTYDPATQASAPVCNKLLDTDLFVGDAGSADAGLVSGARTGYCVEMGAMTSSAGTGP